MVTASSASSSLKEYLKRYENNTEEEKKKKKKKKKPRADGTGLVVVDEDPVWQKQVKLDEDENDESADEEKPQIDEDIEVRRMKRLELLRARRPFGVISEDGSGWVPVSDAPKSSNTTNQASDMSPPRRMRNDTPSPGPESRPSTTENADLSPPRKHRDRNDTPSPEPDRMPSSRADADLSPPPKRRAQNDSPFPEHQLKPSSTGFGDLSPPRQRRKRYARPSPEPETKLSCSLGIDSKQLKLSDISPPCRRRALRDTPSPRSDMETSKSGREVVDLSPPRQQRHQQRYPSPEHERKVSRSTTVDSDLSPPRRSHSQKTADIPDISARHSLPYQNGLGASAAGDLSPPRKSRKDRSPIPSHWLVTENDAAISDLSPPRRRQKESPVKQRPKTGLVTGQDVKEEVAKTKMEELLRFKELDPSVSGRGAEPVYRDKITGKRMTKEEFLKSQKKEKEEKKPKEIKLEWGKGLAQKREAEARLKELEAEKEKPFARSRDDPDLDQMLKERVRWGDPMAHLVKKKALEPVLPDLGDDEKVKESGFIIPQEIPSHSWIRRGVHAPPNRYGIKPGRHWDGVDRSNGCEKEFFKRMNEKRATEREAYMWSVSDM